MTKAILICLFTFLCSSCVYNIDDTYFGARYKSHVIKHRGGIKYLGTKKNYHYFYFNMSMFGAEKVKIKSDLLKIEKEIPLSRKSKKEAVDIKELNIIYNGLSSKSNIIN